MTYPILGLHHVTATVDEAQADLDFCVGALGLRLIKKTVNFDNRHVYHFYYGDAHGTPGTIWTTFPYKGRGVRVGTKGAGQITVTAFSVPARSLEFWAGVLRGRGITVREAEPRFGEAAIVATDPSGLAIELVGAEHDARRGWTAGHAGPDHAVRGLHSVALTIRSPARTTEFLTTVLGFRVLDETEGRTRLSLSGAAPGMLLDIVHAPDAPQAVNGLGTVHHAALAMADGDSQVRLRLELIARGFSVTEVLDRQYFRSIYFREPGGVLLEIATIEPGFTVDEPFASLGRALKLPPWEEPHRAEIEAGLPPVAIPA